MAAATKSSPIITPSLPDIFAILPLTKNVNVVQESHSSTKMYIPCSTSRARKGANGCVYAPFRTTY